jgi:uncharacterized membrane protein
MVKNMVKIIFELLWSMPSFCRFVLKLDSVEKWKNVNGESKSSTCVKRAGFWVAVAGDGRNNQI